MDLEKIKELLDSSESSEENVWSVLHAEIYTAQSTPYKIEEFKRHLSEYLDTASSSWSLAWASLTYALLTERRCHPNETINYLKWARRLFDGTKAKLGIAIIANGLASVYEDIGYPISSKKEIEKSLDILKAKPKSVEWKRERARALRIKSFIILYYWRYSQKEKEDARKCIEEASGIIESKAMDTPADKRAMCILHYYRAYLGQETDTQQLRLAKEKANALYLEDVNSISSRSLFLNYSLKVLQHERKDKGSEEELQEQLKESLVLFSEASNLVQIDKKWICTRYDFIQATSILADAFAACGNVEISRNLIRTHIEIAGAFAQSESELIFAKEILKDVDKNISSFCKQYPQICTGTELFNMKQEYEKFILPFPEVQEAESESTYNYFSEMSKEDLKKLSDEAIEALKSCKSREEAEVAVIKMAPFFLDCTFPRLDEEDQEEMRKCLDDAEEKWESFAEVLGLSSDVKNEEMGESPSSQVAVSRKS